MNKKLMVLLLIVGSMQAGGPSDGTHTPEELREIKEFKFCVITAGALQAPDRGPSLRSQGSSPFLPLLEDKMYTDTIFTKAELQARQKQEARRLAQERREADRACSANLFQSSKPDRTKWKRVSTKSSSLGDLTE